MSLGVALGGLTVSGAVLAEDPPAPLPKAAPAASAPEAASTGDAAFRAAEARRRYQEGNAAVKLRQWQRAYDAYLSAWRQTPHWQVAGSLGQVELKLAKHRDAALHLALFLREAKDVAPDEVKNVREWLEQARARVGVLRINAEPLGSEILIDGVKVGQAPLVEEVYVEPGKHLVEARVGACAARSEVELPAGRVKDVELLCPPGAPAGSVAVAPPALAPAEGPLRAKASPSRLDPLLIAGGGVTLAALALGVTSVALFTAKGSQAQASHEPASGPNATAEANFKSVAVWSFVAAGLVGGGTILYHVKSERRREPPVRGSLSVGPTGGAAVVQGNF